MPKKKNKTNKFSVWVSNLSSYTKNKLINAFLFFIGYLIICGTNHVIMFGQFVPTFFILDFFLVIFLISPIFFFKKTMFDRIYLPILLFLITAFSVINLCFFVCLGAIFSIKDFFWALQLAGIGGMYIYLVPWWIVALNIILWIFFSLAIVLFNALWKFKATQTELNLPRKRKIIFSLALLFGSILCFEISLQIWCSVQRKKGNNDIDYVNYFSNYNYKTLGMIPYYVQEARQLMFDHGDSDQSIIDYLLNYTPVEDKYTGILENNNPNIITIMIETGDDIMINDTTTPNLCQMLNEGMCCEHNYSLNHTNVSNFIAINGNHPQFNINNSLNCEMPFNIPNILSDYQTYFTTDIHPINDIYKTMDVIKKFGFKNYLFHDEVIPNIEPWRYEWNNYTQDSKFMGGLANKIKAIPQTQPFYMHYLTIHMHMTQILMPSNKEMFDDLEARFGWILDEAEAQHKWHNPFEPNTEDWKRFRRYTEKTMDFDEGLGTLCDTLYGDSASDYLKNTLLIFYGDHHWYENTVSGPTFAQTIRHYPDTNIKQYKTVLGLFHPDLIDDFEQDFNHKFTKITWPSVIVPTILDLLGREYNPKIYEGKSIFENDYSNNELFFSNWRTYLMNEHFTSDDGHFITQKWDNEESEEDFNRRLIDLKRQLRIIDSIYLNNFFSRNPYQNFIK